MRPLTLPALACALLLPAPPPAHAHANSDGHGTMTFTLEFNAPIGTSPQPRTVHGGDLGLGTLALDCAWAASGGLHWAGDLTFSSAGAPITGAGESESLTAGFGTIEFPSIRGERGNVRMDMPGNGQYVAQNATFAASASGVYIRSAGTLFLSLRLTGTTVDPDGALPTFAPVTCPDSTLLAELVAMPYAEPGDPIDPPVDGPPIEIEIQGIPLPPIPRVAPPRFRRVLCYGRYEFTDG